MNQKEIDEIITSKSLIDTELSMLDKHIIKNNDTGYKIIYCDKKQIRLIRAKVIESGVKKEVDWYYKDDYLVFSSSEWTALEDGKILTQEKLYFKKSVLVAWESSGNKYLDPGSFEFIDLKNKMIGFSEKWRVESLAAIK